MRKFLKILHSLGSCGLIGGLACHMLLLVSAPQDTPAAYAELREGIAGISNFVLLPSLFITLVTGLLAMVVHAPLLDKGWVWLKAVMGIMMFQGVLVVIVGESRKAAETARELAAGGPAASTLAAAMDREWYALGAIMALSIANVVLGVWRPKVFPNSATPARPNA